MESTTHDKNKMYPGEFLNQGEQLESANGKFLLVLRDDGSLVIGSREGFILWMVGAGKANKLTLERNGNAVLADADGNQLWQSGTMGEDIAALMLNDDGNLVVLDKNDKVKWESGTSQSKLLIYYLRKFFFLFILK